MNIPYDEMPEKIEELMAEVERLESENKHLLDLQKSMDKQYEELEKENQQLLETSKAYKKLLKTTMQKEHNAIKVLDEIRAELKLERKLALSLERTYALSVIDKLLDKVKK